MGEFSTPGKLLGTEEEFVGGEGVFNEGGKLHALYAGDASVDKQKVVSVKPSAAAPRMIAPGMIVYGRIEDIFEPIALVKLEPVESRGARQAQGDYFSILHVSNVRREYVESLRGQVRVGDVIKALVSEIRKGEIYLDLRGPDFGVVKAYCSRCRNPLYLKDKVLICHSCGNQESRKLSSEYSAKEG
jgi:exosome complex component CSL4